MEILIMQFFSLINFFLFISKHLCQHPLSKYPQYMSLFINKQPISHFDVLEESQELPEDDTVKNRNPLELKSD